LINDIGQEEIMKQIEMKLESDHREMILLNDRRIPSDETRTERKKDVDGRARRLGTLLRLLRWFWRGI
jgi:hypothetical protein